jgi:imidazolonepropionase-like amidohydrolase
MNSASRSAPCSTLEGYKVAKEIQAHGASASTFSIGRKMEAFDAIPYNAAIMQKKGVLVSLNSDDAELMRHLNNETGKAIKYGRPGRAEGFAMVTLNPAKQLGIDNRPVDEVGKDADLVIYDKFPPDYAKVQKVLIDGTVYFDRDNEVSGEAARMPRSKADRQGKAESARAAIAPARGSDSEIH